MTLAKPLGRLAAIAGLVLSVPAARAVTFYSTADPTYNTSAPAGSLAGSGWQYEATFGPFLATAVGSHHFLTAKHVGIPSNTLVYQGGTYNLVRYYDDPGSDLRVLEVAETVTSYATFYALDDEVGKGIVVIGRGTERGSAVYVSNSLEGWDWGNTDTVQRWGQNTITQANGSLLYSTFDQNGGPNEASLSSGDSGGPVFINDGQAWRLAGINYGVDGPFAYVAGGQTFYATLFDTRGLFNSTTGQVASGSTPVPSGFYSTRTFTQLHWIRSVVAPALAAISAQGQVGTGNDVIKVSFTISGNSAQTKRVLVRGLGPSLQANGVPLAGRLTNPQIELHDASNAILSTSDDWNGTTTTTAKKKKRKKKSKPATAPTLIQSTNLAPTDSKEAALVATLSPGQYTAILRGVSNATGIGLLDVHDIDGDINGTRLTGLSAFGLVTASSTDFTVKLMVDSSSGRVIIRDAGPDLAGSGVTNPLSDPFMQLQNSSGAIIATNDNWRSGPNSGEIQNSGLAPTDDRDPALLFGPQAATYTVVIQGVNGSTGGTLFKADLLP